MKNNITLVHNLKKIAACILITALILSNFGFLGNFQAYASSQTVSSIQELVSAVSRAKAGDTILLKNGTYENIGAQVISNSNGTEKNPVTVYAETPGGVKFTGGAAFKITGKYIVFGGFDFDNVENLTGQKQVIILDNASYCTVEHNRFTACRNDKYGFSLLRMTNNSQYNAIAYNTFDDSRDISVQVSISSGGNIHNLHNHIHHNYFRNIQSSYDVNGTYNYLECFQVGPSNHDVDTFTILEYNLIENCIGDQQELFSIKTSANTIRYNTFRNSFGAMYVRLGHRNVVDGNYFFNTKNGVVSFGDSNVIKNNYIENPLERGIYLSYDNGKGKMNSTNSIVANNTIINPETVEGIGMAKQCENNTIVNNFVLTDKVPAFGTDGNATYSNNLSQVSGAGSIGLTETGIDTVADAKMTYSDGFWRPGSDSPLIDYGQAVEGITDDMDGQPRTGNPDCGADEYSSAQVLRRPLTYKDVGASWEDKGPLPSPKANPALTPAGAFMEANGKVCIEAERATEFATSAYVSNKSSNIWASSWKEIEGVSGKAVRNLPISTFIYKDTTTLDEKSPEITYTVKINQEGNYDVWLLWTGLNTAQDSSHLGIDNKYETSIFVGEDIVGKDFAWQKVHTFNSLSAGYHDINIWARDSGVMIDKIYLTKEGDTPSDLGPAESVREDKPVEPESQEPLEETKDLPKDISEVLWAKEYIENVISRGIMSGYKEADGSLTFRPNGTATRAEFATALFNYLGLSKDGNATFEDIKNHWAKDYISKLVDMGIINGYSEKEFAPEEFITREQIAAIINRTFKPKADPSDFKYTDHSKISDWAVDSVYAVRAAGLMSGDESGTFRPLDTATRAEIATIFSRLADDLTLE